MYVIFFCEECGKLESKKGSGVLYGNNLNEFRSHKQHNKTTRCLDSGQYADNILSASTNTHFYVMFKKL